MKTFIALFALFLSFSVSAAPFVISDPWPVGPQPDSCIASELPGPTTRSLDLEVGETGHKYIREDLGDATDGSHTWTIVCSSNTAGIAPSVPVDFTFAIGALPGPNGLRLIP